MDLRYSVSIVALFSTLITVAATPDITRLRTMLSGARGSEAIASAFYKETRGFNESSPLLLGFKAMSELLLCDHTSNVVSKYKHFNEGRKLLEAAIEKEPRNPELIYFRYTTQTNAPRMLGYYQNIAADKLILFGFLNSGKKKDLQLYELVKAYLLKSGECNEEEKKLIRKIDEN